MMGGRIELESQVDQGSTFTLYFGDVNIFSDDFSIVNYETPCLPLLKQAVDDVSTSFSVSEF